MKRIKRLIISVAIIAGLLFPGGAALADQADPDSTPTATFYVFRNLLETGDYLLFIDANVPYASIPDEPVITAFTWRLIDTDNTTELGNTVGSAFNDLGYGFNVYSMYFSAADSPVWLTNYTVRLSGNPAVFDDPRIYDFTIGTADYSVLTTTADVQAELAARVIITGTGLNTIWGLTTSLFLTTAQESGTVLSGQGESFFRGAIFGLQAMAPAAFSVIPRTITAEDREWSDAYSTNVSTQFAGTWVATAQTGGANMFNKSYDLVSVIIVLLLCAGVIMAQAIISNNVYAGVIDAAVIAVLFGRLGMYEMSFLALIAAICWLYLSAKVWGLVR